MLIRELKSLKATKGILKQTNKQIKKIADDNGIHVPACLVLLVTVNVFAICLHL